MLSFIFEVEGIETIDQLFLTWVEMMDYIVTRFRNSVWNITNDRLTSLSGNIPLPY